MPKRVVRKIQQYKHSKTGAFWTIIIVSFLVLAYFGYQLHENRTQSQKTQALSEQNARLILRDSALAQDGKDAHDAICVLKRDYIHQINDSARFLLHNPKGIPGIISPEVIINQIHSRISTISSLEKVKCVPPGEKLNRSLIEKVSKGVGKND